MTDTPAIHPVANVNFGPGWYEVINPRAATTCIAYVHENGDLYLPEGENSMTSDEFTFAAARGTAHRLARVDGTGAEQPVTPLPTIDRAAVLREAADRLDRLGLRDLATRELRRMADEAETGGAR